MTWGGDIDEKVESVFGTFGEFGAATGPKRPALRDNTRVPRPVYARKPGLIDLSTAPSAMELAAKRWSGQKVTGA